MPNDGAIAPQLTLAFGVASKELISQVDGSWCATFFIQLEEVYHPLLPLYIYLFR